MVKIKQITRFHKEYEFLSNRYMIKIPYQGLVYPSLEHAYAASRTDNPRIREEIVKNPMGNVLKMDFIIPQQGWHATSILKDLLFIKFGLTSIGEPDERMILFKKLAATGFAKLIWTNTEHDNYFGMCNCGRPQCQVAPKNMLGYALEAVRKTIRERVAASNSMSSTCLCGRSATNRLLWSTWWIPRLTPTCTECFTTRYKDCMTEGDGVVYKYPLLPDDSVDLSDVKSETNNIKIEPKTETKQKSIIYMDECGVYYGMGCYVSSTSTVERKWKSMIWKPE